jgi:hypothetical protein
MLRLANQDGAAEGRWVTYSEGVEIKVRPLTGTTLRDLRRSVAKRRMEPDPSTRKMVAIDDVDPEAFERACCDYLIEDFKGIGDAQGNHLENTVESRLLIMNQLALRDFVWAAAQALDVSADRLKN